MNRHFIEIEVSVSRTLSELFGDFLVENGCKGYITEEGNDKIAVKGYVRGKPEATSLVRKIKRYAESLNKIHKKDLKVKVEFKKIKQEDWSRKWKEDFKPIHATERMVVKPAWIRKRFPWKTVIEIEPKMAFGTGEHSTTRLCLRALEKNIRVKDRVLDLGTGSGILAITAAKLGAPYVLGLDIDEDAISNAKENIFKNRVQKVVNLRLGTLDNNIPADAFDLVTANLTKTQIMELFDRMSRVLKKGGIFILSGIQREEEEEMKKFLSTERVLLKEIHSDKGWVCFVAEKDE